MHEEFRIPVKTYINFCYILEGSILQIRVYQKTLQVIRSQFLLEQLSKAPISWRLFLYSIYFSKQNKYLKESKSEKMFSRKFEKHWLS